MTFPTSCIMRDMIILALELQNCRIAVHKLPCHPSESDFMDIVVIKRDCFLQLFCFCITSTGHLKHNI